MTTAEVLDSLHLTANDICAAATDSSGNILGGLEIDTERLARVIFGVCDRRERNTFCPELRFLPVESIIFIGLSFSRFEIESTTWEVVENLRSAVTAFVTAQALPRRWLFHPDIAALLLDGRFWAERFNWFRARKYCVFYIFL